MKRRSVLRAASLVALLSAPSLALAQSPSGNVERAGLPDGPGKDLVQGICSGCHQVREIQRSLGYTREGWDELTSTMVDMKAAPDQHKEVLDYLAKNFPPSTRRPAKLKVWLMSVSPSF
jgi:mono/diheme cytochrome c family protein